MSDRNSQSPVAMVTGSSGFIGSHLVSGLLDQGWRVVALVRSSTKRAWLESQNISIIEAAYHDQKSFERALQGVEYVFHLGAALRAPDRSVYYKVNVKGTENLLAAVCNQASKLKKFVYVSSIAAAGPSDENKFRDETQPCQPVSLYGESKLAAEKVVQSFSHRLPITIVRPPNVLGPRQKELETILKLIKRRILPMMGNGNLQTSICFVQDLVRALLLVAQRDESINQIYYVTDNRAYSWRAMVQQIASILGTDSNSLKIPHPVLFLVGCLSDAGARLFKTPRLISRGEVKSLRRYYWLFNSAKIQRELGFNPLVHFEEGITEVIHWYRSRRLL